MRAAQPSSGTGSATVTFFIVAVTVMVTGTTTRESAWRQWSLLSVVISVTELDKLGYKKRSLITEVLFLAIVQLNLPIFPVIIY
jgi:hypothetical protein